MRKVTIDIEGFLDFLSEAGVDYEDLVAEMVDDLRRYQHLADNQEEWEAAIEAGRAFVRALRKINCTETP